MKITPKDYVDSQSSLLRVGFVAMRALLDEDKTFEEISTSFGVPESVVAIVKTTTSFAEYETIVRLETERETLEQKVEEVTKTADSKRKLTPWQYAWGSAVLVLIVAAVVFGIVKLIGFIQGLL